MSSKDYYAILGVAKNASASDIKKAFYALAQQHHPDKPGGNEAKFKEINEAYQVLSDADKRARYDQFGSADGSQFGGGNPFGGQGFDFSQFGGFGGGGHGAQFEFNFGGGGGGLDDILAQMMGFGGGARMRRGRDVEVSITVTFAESITGVKKEVEVPEYENGNKKGTKRLAVTVPAGVDSGTVLKIAGMGEQLSDAKAGNLLVVVSVVPHQYLTREGANLVMHKTVKLTDALLGATIETEHYDGKKLSIEMPAGVAHGQVLRVKGKGVPRERTGAGDLLVVISIDIPKKLSKEAKKAVDVLRGEGY